MGLRAGDRNLGLIPLGHSYGLGNLVLPLLIRGTSLVLAREFVPQQILPWMERYEVTVLPSVPAIYRLLAHLPGRGKPPTWRLAISAGAMLSPSIAQEFHQRFGLKLHNFYGSSETGGICYDRTGAATLSGRSVGKPLQGVTVSIGAGGKVKVRSRAVVTGRKASGACSRILEDLGEWTKQKELRLLGRAQPMANVAGRKVNPLEVEQLLRGMPGVNEAWVGVFQDRRGRDYLGAAVETEQAGPVVQRNLEKLLPTWKWPRAYTVKKILPRTERGKLDRVKLQQVLAKA
jgi:acyl-coenzyme A synthetase/AMP-(fatty) acid ligase